MMRRDFLKTVVTLPLLTSGGCSKVPAKYATGGVITSGTVIFMPLPAHVVWDSKNKVWKMADYVHKAVKDITVKFGGESHVA